MSALILEEVQESTVQWHLNEYKFSLNWSSSTFGPFPADSVSERREKQFHFSVLILFMLLAVFKKDELWLFYLYKQLKLVKDSLSRSDNGKWAYLIHILHLKPIHLQVFKPYFQTIRVIQKLDKLSQEGVTFLSLSREE